jgi:hypothetical protein
MRASSFTSRTVPMNAATAPTRGSSPRSRASSRETSKSSAWTRTGMLRETGQPPVTGGNSANLVAGTTGVSGCASA